LLLAHGAPERLEDVESYLSYVRGGRPGSPKILEEVRSRYQAIGGSSPLLRWTRAQAQALERALGIPVFFGMRNWRPFIRETMDRVRESGVERLAAIALAPQYSELSVGLYISRTEEAARDAGVGAEIRWAKSYHADPLLIEAFSERLERIWTGQKVLFTAHSLPEKILAAGDPYDRETRATAAAVAARLGVSDFDFAYQSQGFTDDRWLAPPWKPAWTVTPPPASARWRSTLSGSCATTWRSCTTSTCCSAGTRPGGGLRSCGRTL